MIRHTALKLAELKQIPLEEVARTTTANAKKIFKILAG
jgi:Tat protein secretion system quality control protein TatD with DNase activity